MEGCVTMRVLRKEVPQDVSLQDCLDFLQDIKLSKIEIEKSLRGNARYKSFLESGTMFDIRFPVTLPNYKDKFLEILKVHCLLRRKVDDWAVLILDVINEYSLRQGLYNGPTAPLFNTVSEWILLNQQSDRWSDQSLQSYVENEYLGLLQKVNTSIKLMNMEALPISRPQRKRGYTDKGNFPDPRTSILGKNYRLEEDYDDLKVHLDRLRRKQQAEDTISFIRGMYL